jgi:hypothetical protein
MGWSGRLASRWKYPEQQVWFGVGAWAAVLTVLVILVAANYSTVILTHTVVTLTPDQVVEFKGTNATGVLLADGSVTLTLRLTVTNPSSRLLAFTSIAYKSWIEDLPAEAGLPGLGRSDDVLVNETGTHLFFKAFLGSFDVSLPIPASGIGTREFSFNLSSIFAARFQAVRDITAYASQTLGDGTAVSWIHWVRLVVTFRDVPPPTATSSGYLSDMTRIVLEEGPNLG